MRPTLLDELRLACEHEFAPTAQRSMKLGQWDLPIVYRRCEKCGYREVDHYTFAPGTFDCPYRTTEAV